MVIDLFVFPVISSFQDVSGWKLRRIARDLPQAQKRNSYRLGTTPEINAEAAKMIMNAGLRYKAFTMIGSPGETHEDVQKTIGWLKDVQPDGFDISILSPYPGSSIYNESTPSTKYDGFDREHEGLYFKQIDYSKEDSFYKGKPGEYTCHVRTDDLSAKDILKLRDEMESGLKK